MRLRLKSGLMHHENLQIHVATLLTCTSSHQTFTPPTVPRSTTTKYSLSGVNLRTQLFTDFVNVATISVHDQDNNKSPSTIQECYLSTCNVYILTIKLTRESCNTTNVQLFGSETHFPGMRRHVIVARKCLIPPDWRVALLELHLYQRHCSLSDGDPCT